VDRREQRAISAQNFIWNVSLRYSKHGPSRNEEWLKARGFSIPANARVPLKTRFPREIVGNALQIEVKIEFWFTDIFGQRWFEESYFQGVVYHPIMLVDGVPKGTGEYAVELRKAAESQKLFRRRQETGIAQECVVEPARLKPALKRLWTVG
jgi:hypothetical protein